MISALGRVCVGLALDAAALKEYIVQTDLVSGEELQLHIDAYREHHEQAARERLIEILTGRDSDGPDDGGEWERLWRSLM